MYCLLKFDDHVETFEAVDEVEARWSANTSVAHVKRDAILYVNGYREKTIRFRAPRQRPTLGDSIRHNFDPHTWKHHLTDEQKAVYVAHWADEYRHTFEEAYLLFSIILS